MEAIEQKKICLLTISDMPTFFSGVGIQARYIIEALLKTGRYKVVSIGSALKLDEEHKAPFKTDQWGDDWIIYPYEGGYGDKDIINHIVNMHRPDQMFIFSDPRFYERVWMMDYEIRRNFPLCYVHVWDNFPTPHFNKPYYESNDIIATISKVTDQIVREVAPDVECIHHPHSVDTNIFKKIDPKAVVEYKEQTLGKNLPNYKDRFYFFWNNRNAPRKHPGTLLFWYKDFLDKNNLHDKCSLILHTDLISQGNMEGMHLEAILGDLNLIQGQVVLSTAKLPPEILSALYNSVDCTINISEAEGFGLSTLESLACETPIIVTKTGGLTEQVTDGVNEFGIGIEATNRYIIGNAMCHYIYQDRISQQDFIAALEKMYFMPKEEREKLGKLGREHVMKNYNFEDYEKKCVALFDHIYEKYGSWENRKNYKHYSVTTI